MTQVQIWEDLPDRPSESSIAQECTAFYTVPKRAVELIKIRNQRAVLNLLCEKLPEMITSEITTMHQVIVAIRYFQETSLP